MPPIRTMSISTTARSTATSSACAASSARSIPISTRSRRSMAQATAFRTMVEATPPDQEDAPLVWSARWSLTTRILAVNIIAVALLAGGFFYLDTYPPRLVDTALQGMEDQLAMLDSAPEAARPDQPERNR